MNALTNGIGTISELDGLLNACEPDSVTPSLVRKEGAQTVGPATFGIKRYFLLWTTTELKVLAARESVEKWLAEVLCAIAEFMFIAEVCKKYPKLIGKPIVIYNDWTLGLEPHKEKEDEATKVVSAPAMVAKLQTALCTDGVLVLH